MEDVSNLQPMTQLSWIFKRWVNQAGLSIWNIDIDEQPCPSWFRILWVPKGGRIGKNRGEQSIGEELRTYDRAKNDGILTPTNTISAMEAGVKVLAAAIAAQEALIRQSIDVELPYADPPYTVCKPVEKKEEEKPKEWNKQKTLWKLLEKASVNLWKYYSRSKRTSVRSASC